MNGGGGLRGKEVRQGLWPHENSHLGGFQIFGSWFLLNQNKMIVIIVVDYIIALVFKVL